MLGMPPGGNRRPKSGRRGARPTSPLGGQSPRILVVEDEYLVALEIEAGLVDAGYAVVGIASSAEEALRVAAGERPDLVVMDVQLRGKQDGIAAARELLERFGLRSLMATAHYDSHHVARAEAAAPLGWIAKPFTVDALVARVRAALAELAKKG